MRRNEAALLVCVCVSVSVCVCILYTCACLSVCVSAGVCVRSYVAAPPALPRAWPSLVLWALSLVLGDLTPLCFLMPCKTLNPKPSLNPKPVQRKYDPAKAMEVLDSEKATKAFKKIAKADKKGEALPDPVLGRLRPDKVWLFNRQTHICTRTPLHTRTRVSHPAAHDNEPRENNCANAC